MANQAMVKPGDFVFDPFLGTGSLAIAAAEVGALVWGGDIDMRVINGKQGRNLASCFRLYGLGTPEIVRMDNSARYLNPSFDTPLLILVSLLLFRCFREVPLFHAIICDPPYGVRAGARKSGVDPKDGAPVVGPSEEFRSISFPRTSVYEAVDVGGLPSVLLYTC